MGPLSCQHALEPHGGSDAPASGLGPSVLPLLEQGQLRCGPASATAVTMVRASVCGGQREACGAVGWGWHDKAAFGVRDWDQEVARTGRRRR